MDIHELKIADRYDENSQKVIGCLAAVLDAQLEQLKKVVDGLQVEQLEWQAQPGMNSIGMLIAHNAIVEVFWINVAAAGLPPEPEGDEIIRETIGIGGKDDGIPLSEKGKHPESLKGKTLNDYLRMMEAAREATHSALKRWNDAELEMTYTLEDHVFTQGWTVYHVLEHFIGHLGQIRLLKHMMKK